MPLFAYYWYTAVVEETCRAKEQQPTTRRAASCCCSPTVRRLFSCVESETEGTFVSRGGATAGTTYAHGCVSPPAVKSHEINRNSTEFQNKFVAPPFSERPLFPPSRLYRRTRHFARTAYEHTFKLKSWKHAPHVIRHLVAADIPSVPPVIAADRIRLRRLSSTHTQIR